MKRRTFIKNSLIATPIIATGIGFAQIRSKSIVKHNFKLKFAPHDGMFKYSSSRFIIDQIQFMADTGFRAFEDNEFKKRPLSQQKQIAKVLENNNMEMGVFVAHNIHWKEPNLASGDENKQIAFLKQIKESVEVAKRVNAKWMTVVPGYLDLTKDLPKQTINVVETLKKASEILEPENLVMVLEPLNFRDHPGMFLSKSAHAYQICKAVASPSCKILFDIYHQQITEGNLLPNIESYWDEIAYFQIGDNPGRNEPTTGEINYKNVFKFIKSKNYKGILGMEHGNSEDGRKGEEQVIMAYKKI